MGYKYHGPPVEKLPDSIRDRIKEAARIAEYETGALGVVVNKDTKRALKGSEEYREVFCYDSGTLQEVFFNIGDQTFNMSFCGMRSQADMSKVEEALVIKVNQRPRRNIDVAEITVEEQPLEKIIGLSSPQALYMGRR
jgi:hypothetical protein